jgi:hypothetical protein
MSSNVWKQAAVVILAFAAGAMAMNFAAVRGATAQTSVHAAALATTPAAQFDSDSQCAAQVPRAWGEFKGGSSQSGLAFQAPDGTLRFVTNLPCGAQPVIALKIIRTEKGSSN